MFGPEYEIHELRPEQASPPSRDGREAQSESAADIATSSSATLAERLNFLFESVHPGSAGPYSTGEVAAKLRFRGHAISAAYLTSLRLGLEDELSRGAKIALARIF